MSYFEVIRFRHTARTGPAICTKNYKPSATKQDLLMAAKLFLMESQSFFSVYSNMKS